MNGQITEVKQQIPRLILRWLPFGIHNFLQFGRNIRQIWHICQLNQNFKKPRKLFTSSVMLVDAYSKVEQQLGAVSVLVNNAGIANEIDWNKMVDVNTVPCSRLNI